MPLLLVGLQPSGPATRQVAVQEVHQRLGHRIVDDAKHALAPRAVGKRHLAVHQHAQALAKLLHELRTISCHLHPRAKALGKLLVEHVTERTRHGCHLVLPLLVQELPLLPAARQVAVQEVVQSFGHRVVGLPKDAGSPGTIGQSHLTVHQHAQPFPEFLHESSTVRGHLHPRTPALAQLAVQNVAKRLPHRLTATHGLCPHRMPADPAACEFAVHKVAQCLAHVRHAIRLLGRALDHVPPACKAKRHLPVHQHAQALAKLLHELRPLYSHLHPRPEALAQLAV